MKFQRVTIIRYRFEEYIELIDLEIKSEDNFLLITLSIMIINHCAVAYYF